MSESRFRPNQRSNPFESSQRRPHSDRDVSRNSQPYAKASLGASTPSNERNKPSTPHNTTSNTPLSNNEDESQGAANGGYSSQYGNRGIISSVPTSRLCFKSLPIEMTEQQLRQKITVDTKKSGGAQTGPVVQITECKIMRNTDGRSRRMAFVGFKTVEQAKIAQFYWHRAYMSTSRVTAEFAHPPGNDLVPRAWSRYTEGSSAYREANPDAVPEASENRSATAVSSRPDSKESVGKIAESSEGSYVGRKDRSSEDVQKRKQLKALSFHPALHALSPAQREQVLKDPRFFEFIQLSLSRKTKERKFWDNDDQSMETKTLRAVYLATQGEQKDGKPSDTQADSNESYESLMKELKSKKGGDVSDDEDDEDVNDIDFDLKDVKTSKSKKTTEVEGDEGSTDNPELRHMIKDILSSNKANDKSLSDKDYFKSLQASDFDDDDDDDEDDDDDIDGGKTENSLLGKKRRASKSADVDDFGNPDPQGDEADEDEDSESENGTDDNILDKDNTSKRVKTVITPEELVMETGRLFFKNLSYLTTEDELEEFCSQYGRIAEVHIPRDVTRQGKGFGYVLFMLPEDAKSAWRSLDKTLFQGRIVHVCPAEAKPESEESAKAGHRSAAEVLAAMGDDEKDSMNYKRKKQLMQQAGAESKENWNTLFISQDTIANAVAAKFSVSRADMLGADAAEEKDNIAVRMAIAETHVIQETKSYLENHGVVLDAFTAVARQGGLQVERSNKVILVKNIPFDTTEAELRRPFARFGKVLRFILPPYRTVALVEFEDAKEAKRAFTALAYKKFKHVPLYLEWAPAKALKERAGLKASDLTDTFEEPSKIHETVAERIAGVANEMLEAADRRAREQEEEFERSSPKAIFVKNLHFLTREPALRDTFVRLVAAAWKAHLAALQQKGRSAPSADQEWRVRSVFISKRQKEAKEESKPSPDGMLSLGYGFIEFSHAAGAQAVVNAIIAQRGLELDGHLLEVKLSHRSGAGTEAAAAVAAKHAVTCEALAAAGGVRKQTSILEERGHITQEKLKQQEKWSQISSKLMVRNVPFQATLQEIRELFSAFGQIKRCRMPKKTHSNEHRGFAFVDFVTPQEARNAFTALQATHLYGRHLVLEWADPAETVEELREKAAKSVGRK